MNVLVTGGAGFIGAHVVNALTARGHRPVVVDRLDSGRSRYLPDAREVPVIPLDVRNVDDVLAAVPPCDVVIHLAAQISVPVGETHPRLMAEDNVTGTVAALEIARALGAREFRFASTAAVYGDPGELLPVTERSRLNPLSFYGISKQSAELFCGHYCGMHGIVPVILRLANVYGPGQSAVGEGGVVSRFAERLLGSQPLVRHGDGEQTRDFVYVGDVAQAFCHRLGQTEALTVNIGTGLRTSVNQLGSEMARAAERPLHWTLEPPRLGDIRDSVFDPTTAQQWGFVATTALSAGLALTLSAWSA